MEKGERGLSSSWREHLAQHGLGPESVLDDNPKFTLVGEILVQAARQIGMNVYHDPTGNRPIRCAHSAIDWPEDSKEPDSDRPSKPERKRIKNDLALAFNFIFGEVTSERPAAN